VYPLTLLTIYTIIYVFIFRVRPPTLDAISYVVLVLSGLVPLIMFAETLPAGVGSISAHRNLLLNTVFPSELIPLRSVLAAQTPSLSALLLTTFGAAALGRPALYAPFALAMLWILLLMFITGIVWCLSLVSLVLRDIQQALGLITMSAVILSPAAYTPEMVPESLKLILYLNPLSYFVLCFQAVICYGTLPPLPYFVMAAALGISSFFAGFWFFSKAKYVFFDYA
jgi:lipopolysaccharide transport system permease protein